MITNRPQSNVIGVIGVSGVSGVSGADVQFRRFYETAFSESAWSVAVRGDG